MIRRQLTRHTIMGLAVVGAGMLTGWALTSNADDFSGLPDAPAIVTVAKTPTDLPSRPGNVEVSQPMPRPAPQKSKPMPYAAPAGNPEQPRSLPAQPAPTPAGSQTPPASSAGSPSASRTTTPTPPKDKVIEDSGG